jgi:hypothetical protein
MEEMTTRLPTTPLPEKFVPPFNFLADKTGVEKWNGNGSESKKSSWCADTYMWTAINAKQNFVMDTQENDNSFLEISFFSNLVKKGKFFNIFEFYMETLKRIKTFFRQKFETNFEKRKVGVIFGFNWKHNLSLSVSPHTDVHYPYSPLAPSLIMEGFKNQVDHITNPKSCVTENLFISPLRFVDCVFLFYSHYKTLYSKFISCMRTIFIRISTIKPYDVSNQKKRVCRYVDQKHHQSTLNLSLLWWMP